MTSIENKLVVEVGVVENTNVDPPFDVVNAVTLASDVTMKSEAMPVVAPTELDTLMVHAIACPTRAGTVFVHDMLETDVGVS